MTRVLTFAALAFFVCAATAQAQIIQASSTVSAQGEATSSKPAQIVRVEVELMGRGGTVEEALASLEDRVESAREKLAQLGADDDSVELTEPAVSTEYVMRQRQIQQMLAEQMRGRPGAEDRFSMPEVIAVTRVLRTDWPISGDSTTEVLEFCYGLTSELDDLDLAGSEEESELSAEQQEIMEELEQMGYGRRIQMPKPEPRYSYVRIVSEEERKQTVAEAFEMARDRALVAVSPTGVELGTIEQITMAERFADENSGQVYYDEYGRAIRAQPSGLTDPSRHEATSTVPGMVAYEVRVQASFKMGE